MQYLVNLNDINKTTSIRTIHKIDYNRHPPAVLHMCTVRVFIIISCIFATAQHLKHKMPTH